MSEQLTLGPPSRFGTITADPPWKESGGGECKRGADRHYPLLGKQDIVKAMLGSGLFLPHDNAHLYLWVTNNFLEDGLWVMRRLGFRYVTNIAWVKDRMGIGQYFRGRHELALFGVRGDGYIVRTERRNLDTVIEAPRGRHSEKPAAFFDLVEKRSFGPYLEMFARDTTRAGWTYWGNEVAT